MTMHHKFDMFVLDLSFIGWRILGSLLIIGNWFVNPYYEGVLAELYPVSYTHLDVYKRQCCTFIIKGC